LVIIFIAATLHCVWWSRLVVGRIIPMEPVIAGLLSYNIILFSCT
jgi:hypothetical protein